MARSQSSMLVSTGELCSIPVLTVEGVLDGTTYGQLRDTVIKVALEVPRAVIIDITGLLVPAESALAVFTSARWHVSVWPDVPLALVCEHAQGRDAIARNGITRYMPVYSSVGSACAAVDNDAIVPQRLRAHAQLPAVDSSLHRARELLTDWLSAWSRGDLIPVASVVADVLVENVLRHTRSSPGLRVESKGDSLTVAVEDGSRTAAARHERPRLGSETVSGLAVVAALARAWGSTPTSTGKTVWAVIGPENSI